jgi:hypothetical protein
MKLTTEQMLETFEALCQTSELDFLSEETQRIVQGIQDLIVAFWEWQTRISMIISRLDDSDAFSLLREIRDFGKEGK